MSCFIGIDVGTSSVKSIIMAPDGKIIDIAQRTYDVICPKPLWAEIPVRDLWDATKETLCELSQKHPEQIRQALAISFSGQMHSLVLLDENDKPLRNAITWLDTRAKPEAVEIERLCEKNGYRSMLLNTITPCVFVSFMYWLNRYEPETMKKARRAMLVKDYIRYMISGEFGSDYSDAASTIIFDQVKREWAWRIMDDLSFNKELFPKEVHYASDIAGTVSKACSVETGLRAGTPVCFGGGDTLMNHIGNGLIKNDGRILSTIGTSSHVSTGLSSPLSDALGRGFTYCHALEEKWLMLVGGPNGGIVMKWLRDNILGRNYSFDEMCRIAIRAPAGSNGVRCVPYIGGATYPNNPDAKSVYVGLGLHHGQSELIRSTMEGMIYILRKSLDVLTDLGIEATSIIATGGGSKDDMLLRIQADMYNLPVRLNLGKEVSCMGAAISASVGCGYYKDYQEACNAIVRFSPTVIEPDPNGAAVYREVVPELDEVYLKNKQFFR